MILSLLFASGGEHCDLALAVEVRQGGGRGQGVELTENLTTLTQQVGKNYYLEWLKAPGELRVPRGMICICPSEGQTHGPELGRTPGRPGEFLAGDSTSVETCEIQ